MYSALQFVTYGVAKLQTSHGAHADPSLPLKQQLWAHEDSKLDQKEM